MLEFQEPFDGFATSDLAKFFQLVGSSGQAISAGTGRFGQNSLRCTSGNARVGRALTTARTTLFQNIWMRWPTTLEYSPIITFFDGVSGFSNALIQLNADGSFSLVRMAGNAAPMNPAGGTVVASTAPGVITAGVGHLVQFKVTIDGAAGVFVVKIDGATVLTATGLNTHNTSANAQITMAILGKGSGLSTVDFDDWLGYSDFVNTPDDGLTGFTGDLVAEYKRPNAAGTTTQWTPSGAATNYGCVADATPDGDTTRVASSSVGQKDTYGHEALTRISTGIVMTVVRAVAKKSTAGTRAIATMLRSSAVENQGADAYLATDYGVIDQARFVDPNTSLAWAASAVDASEIGQKLSV